VAILATVGEDGPWAIPVSALRRAGEDRVLLALARTRRSLARLRVDPRVALALIGDGFSLTATGPAHVVADPLPGAEFMAAVEVRAERLESTLGAHTVVHAGIAWGWRDAASDARHRQVLSALAALG
jgi:Pyridoxamine 5'-phosphate oxidase